MKVSNHAHTNEIKWEKGFSFSLNDRAVADRGLGTGTETHRILSGELRKDGRLELKMFRY